MACSRQLSRPTPLVICVTAAANQMYIRYPVRNFKCPFCGTKMPTETFRASEPWICTGCSEALQFLQTHRSVVQLCMFGVALLGLYSAGVAGWHLAVGTILAGLVLNIVLAGPLDRVVPPPLEPYEAPFWKQGKQDKYGRLHLDERIEPEGDKQDDSSTPS